MHMEYNTGNIHAGARHGAKVRQACTYMSFVCFAKLTPALHEGPTFQQSPRTEIGRHDAQSRQLLRLVEEEENKDDIGNANARTSSMISIPRVPQRK